MTTYLLIVDFNRETNSDRKKGQKELEDALGELGYYEALNTENTYKLETKRKHIRVRRTLSRALERADDLVFAEAVKIQSI